MNISKNGLIVGLFLVVLLVFGSNLLGAANPPADALAAAQDGLKVFIELDNGVSMDECVFNVTAREELNDAVIGFGFRMFTIDPRNLCEPGDRSLSGIVMPTPEWCFMVLSKNKAIGLISVSRVDGNWQAVGAGAAELANEVHQVRKSWSADKGFNFRFVRVYQATSDFMEVTHKENVLGYVPMKAARVSLSLGQMDLETNHLMAESELMAPLRERAVRNMKGFNKDAFSKEAK